MICNYIHLVVAHLPLFQCWNIGPDLVEIVDLEPVEDKASTPPHIPIKYSFMPLL